MHPIHASLRWVNDKDHKTVAGLLRPIHTPPTEQAAKDASTRSPTATSHGHPAFIRAGHTPGSTSYSSEYVIPFFDSVPETARSSGTNMIQNINSQLCSSTHARNDPPWHEALIKVLHLACKQMGRNTTRDNAGPGNVSARQHSTSSTSCSPAAWTVPEPMTRHALAQTR